MSPDSLKLVVKNGFEKFEVHKEDASFAEPCVHNIKFYIERTCLFQTALLHLGRTYAARNVHPLCSDLTKKAQFSLELAGLGQN